MNRIYEFDIFRVDGEKRQLWRGEKIVHIKPKTFDTLLVFLQNPNEIISKDDLVEEIWNGLAVSDDSLTQQISQLRKLLGGNTDEHHFIITVPGVGYKFVADVETHIGYKPVQITNYTDKFEIGKKELNKNTPFQQTSRFGQKRFWAFGFVVLLILGLTAVYFWQNGTSPKTTALGIEKIAVLPFRVTLQDDQTILLKQGMTDTLVSRLSKIDKITVLSSSLTASYEKSNQLPAAFGRKIGADAVLDGQSHKIGDQLRIIVQLIRCNDDKVLWSEEFHNDFTNIFELQSAIAYKITQALSLELSDEEKRAVMKRHTTSAEAYRLYLDAFYIWAKRRNGEA